VSLHDRATLHIAHAEAEANEFALRRCCVSKELEDAGDYEAAAEVLGHLWVGVAQHPDLEGLDQKAAAEVLLRAGVLTGYLGSARQIVGAQEEAKNLISEAHRVFESLGCMERADESRVELALCYWREGALDEARLLLREVLRQVAEPKARALALLRSAIVEKTANRHHEALSIYAEAAPLFDSLESHSLKGRFHNGLANVLKNLGAAEGRGDYFDRALIEYAAAGYHFEQAGHTRYLARVENNMGMLSLTAGRLEEAQEHLDRARRLFSSLGDRGSVAQVDESRSRAFLKGGSYVEAEEAARSAVEALEEGGEQSLLAEALTTHGVAFARLGRRGRALSTFRRAEGVALQAGDRAAAGQAALTMMEEMADDLSREEMCAVFGRASEALAEARCPQTLVRLNTCAGLIIRELTAGERRSPPSTWRGFSLKDAVRLYEGEMIRRALDETDGVVSRAAQLLGLKSHQNLVHMINNRHSELLASRTPVIRRGRGLKSHGGKPGSKK
jgi:tetratricopeptide (TPR) repeat protein